MTKNAKDKLKLILGGGAVILAALIGAIAGSWMLFLLVVAGLLTVCVQTGLIRGSNGPTRTRRR
jgi:hypothetical protein